MSVLMRITTGSQLCVRYVLMINLDARVVVGVCFFPSFLCFPFSWINLYKKKIFLNKRGRRMFFRFSCQGKERMFCLLNCELCRGRPLVRHIHTHGCIITQEIPLCHAERNLFMRLSFFLFSFFFRMMANAYAARRGGKCP